WHSALRQLESFVNPIVQDQCQRARTERPITFRRSHSGQRTEADHPGARHFKIWTVEERIREPQLRGDALQCLRRRRKLTLLVRRDRPGLHTNELCQLTHGHTTAAPRQLKSRRVNQLIQSAYARRLTSISMSGRSSIEVSNGSV